MRSWGPSSPLSRAAWPAGFGALGDKAVHSQGLQPLHQDGGGYHGEHLHPRLLPGPIHDNYKQAILRAKDSDTTVTGRSVNAPVRILKNQMSREYLKQERAGVSREELEKFTLGSLRRAVFDGDTKTGSLMCGQNAGLLHEIRPHPHGEGRHAGLSVPGLGQLLLRPLKAQLF